MVACLNIEEPQFDEPRRLMVMLINKWTAAPSNDSLAVRSVSTHNASYYEADLEGFFRV